MRIAAYYARERGAWRASLILLGNTSTGIQHQNMAEASLILAY
jgi:hypothetical protein